VDAIDGRNRLRASQPSTNITFDARYLAGMIFAVADIQASPRGPSLGDGAAAPSDFWLLTPSTPISRRDITGEALA
jgi:hypothetical protein